jgi:spore germination protein
VKRIFGRLIIATVVIVYAASSFRQNISADQRAAFDDIGTSYATNEIIDLYNKKIITGTSQTSFSPTKSMTRAEFITVLERLLKLDPVASPVTSFKDLPKNAWYYGSIQAAVQLNLATGTSTTTFSPNKAVTRQEAAVWIAKALKQTNNNTSNLTVYKDSDHIASWASGPVAGC